MMRGMKKIKVGVVGIGHLGKEHARIYKEIPDTELVGVCDVNSACQEKAQELNVPLYKDHRELLDKVEAVSIAVPTALHSAIAQDFLKKGIHTLVEKPMTLKLEDADQLLRLAEENRCILKVGHLERFNAGFRAIKKVLNAPRFIEIHRLGPFTGRINDCGVVLDLMIHDIDIVLGLVDSEIESLDAVGVNVLTPYEDIANVRMRFKNGTVVNFTASRLTPEKQRKIRIFQDDAYISLDYGSQTAQIFRKHGFAISRDEIDIRKEEPLKNELLDFIQAVQKGKPVEPDYEARRALEVALRIVDEIKKHQRNSFFPLGK